MSDKREVSMIKIFHHLYKSHRDSDGTPNCGEADYYYFQAYNDALRDAEGFISNKIQDLEEELKQKTKAIELYEKCRAFYADKVNWIENQIGDFDIEQDGYGICDPEWGGKLARETGEKVKEILG